jgi:predicted phage tail component-like protein
MPLKSFIFNNHRIEGIYLLQGRNKSPFSPVIRELTEYSGGHRLKKTTRGLIEISQPISFLEDGDEQFINKVEYLTEKLIFDDFKTLIFEDEPRRSYPAVLMNDVSDFERMLNYGKGTLSFTALYAAGKEIELNLMPERRSYFITGQRETDWISRTTFKAATSEFVLEEAAGGRIILNYEFIQGDVLMIDYHKRKVLLNGKSLATAIALNTVWFPLLPGTMNLKASADTTLEYQERFH